MSSISIVIPCFNKWELTHSLLFDIYNFNRSVDEVLVVDNGSTDIAVQQGLQWWQENKMLPIQVLSIKDNVGFLLASNQGIKESRGEIILLLSNDVRILRPILDEIRQKLVGKIILGGRLLDFPTGWNNFKNKLCQYLEGYLLVFTKNVWQELGGFDERYAPSDMEDIDFSTAAIEKGYILETLDSDKIIHLGGQTIGFSDERAKITTINREKFRQKWNLEYV